MIYMKQELEQKEMYEESGQMQGAVGAVIMLITGVGVSVLVLIFVGALGGQTYNLVEPDLDSISNGTVQASVKNAIISGFSGLEQTGSYLPIIVLAIVITLVLFLILGMVSGIGSQTGGPRGGSVL